MYKQEFAIKVLTLLSLILIFSYDSNNYYLKTMAEVVSISIFAVFGLGATLLLIIFLACTLKDIIEVLIFGFEG